MSNSIQTHTGARVCIPDTDPDSIRIEDIAHALSNVCRFAGHTKYHYSVAAHSMSVADLVRPEHKLQALLHDASEAYLCDIPTPFKLLLPDYQQLEYNLSLVIADKFDISPELHEAVIKADRIMLMSERDVLKEVSDNWGEEYESVARRTDLVDKYKGIPRESICNMFLEYYARLTHKEE